MEGYLAEIKMFGGNFAPRNWAYCQGQLLAIAQNQALFSLLGTTYGGDGRTTFGLPDMRGRASVGSGRGPGLTDRRIGQKLGTETNTLNQTQLPTHNHSAQLRAESAAGTSGNPTGNLLGVVTTEADIYAPPVPAEEVDMSSDAIVVNNSGGGQPVNNMQPSLVLNYIICTNGLYPSRN
jgi:microcystin-dependent protein